MTLRNRVARTLDRPGTRWMLGFLSTRLARVKTGRDVGFFYDEGWIHQIDGHHVVASQHFAWDVRPYSRVFDDCRDYWLHLYQPTVGDTIVDVGAGNGSDVIAFSHLVGDAGKVLAIEAHPATYRLLEKQCQWNRLMNVQTAKRAIMAGPGIVAIDDNLDDIFNAVIANPGLKKTHTVPGGSLDDLCREKGIDHVDFLKMNIEGAERFAIEGMRGILSKTRHVCIACHDFLADRGGSESMRTRALVIDFLRTEGFETILRDDDPRDYVRDHVHARRP